MIKHGVFAAILAIGASIGSANAVTVTFGNTPETVVANAAADVVTGTVFENVTGSIRNVRRSAWQGSTVNENDAGAFYTSVSRHSSATYNFATAQTSVNLLWGSPDSYNYLDLMLVGGGKVTVNGAAAQGPVAILQQFVTISGVGAFDAVVFRSSNNAFEFANLSTSGPAGVSAAVPLPAGLPLMLSAFAGLGLLSRSRKSARR